MDVLFFGYTVQARLSSNMQFSGEGLFFHSPFNSPKKHMFSSSKGLFRGHPCPSIAAGQFCRLLCCPFDHPERVKRESENGSDSAEMVKRRKLEVGQGVARVAGDSSGGKLELPGARQALNQRDRPEIEGVGASPKTEGGRAEGAEKEFASSQSSQKEQQETPHASATPQASASPQTSAPPQHVSSSVSEDVLKQGKNGITSKSEKSSVKQPGSRDIYQPSSSREPPVSSIDTRTSSSPKSALEAVMTTSASPSQSRDGSRNTSASPSSSRDAEHLMPTTIFPCPATVPQRIAYLKAIHSALTDKRKLKFPKRAAILEELAAAKRSAGNYMVYTNECRVLVKSIKDGSWRGGKAGGTKTDSKTSGHITSSISNQLDMLASKTKPLLAQNGYPVNPDPLKSGLPSNIGIQHCDRCDKAFDVPKVDNYGSCKYHWARARMGGNSTMPEKFYPCCNQPVGMSEGCEEAPRHVYKLHDLNDLAFVIPFRTVSTSESLDTSTSTSTSTSATTSAPSAKSTKTASRPASTPTKSLTSSLDLEKSRQPFNKARRPRTIFNGPAVNQREPDITLETMKRGIGESRGQADSQERSSEPRERSARVREQPSGSCDQAGSLQTSVVAVDCEMLYTSLGMELCRVTCIDYHGKKTLDRVVRPTGRILDYNTRFSGISDINEPIITESGEKGDSISFEEAHRLILKLINKQTILVGHGLENDLIAMRLIHDRIIDTSIIYPDFNPRYKTALKTLALKYLKRTIQTGEHDSMEDALAALDVVKCHLKG